MNKQEVIDILEKLNNGRVCYAFVEQRVSADSCEGCPLQDKEEECITETLIKKIKDTM